VSRLIGEAYISLLADASQFRPDADAKVKAALSGLRPSIKLQADATDVDSKITAIAAALKGLSGDVKIDGDNRGLIESIGEAETAVLVLMERLDGLQLDATNSKFLSKVYGAKAVVGDLAHQLENMDADGDMNRILSKLYGVVSVVEGLEVDLSHLTPDMNPAKMEAKLGIMAGSIKELSSELANMRADTTDAALLSKITAAQAYVLKLAKSMENMPMSADTLPLESDIFKAIALVETLKKTMNIPVRAYVLPGVPGAYSTAGTGSYNAGEAQYLDELTTKTLADLTATDRLTRSTEQFQGAMAQAATDLQHERQYMDDLVNSTMNAAMATDHLTNTQDDFEQTMARMKYSGGVGPQPVPLALQKAASLSTTGVDDLDQKLRVLNTDLDGFGTKGLFAASVLEKFAAQNSMIIASGATGWWSFLNAKIATFGGIFGSFMPGLLSSVHVWHLLGDAIFEFAAAWAPALIAVGAFAAYAFPVGEKIYGQWKNINVILDGVGGKLTDLGPQFDNIERAIEPSILIAFGEWMQIITGNSANLGTALAKVGVVVDNWGADLVNWSQKGAKAIHDIISSGSGDFEAIGRGFQALGAIFGAFFKAMPGYVHLLLAIGDGFLQATAAIMQSPVGNFFLRVGLAIHGFIIYAGLAVTAVYALGRAISAAAIGTYLTKMGMASEVTGDALASAQGKFNKFGTAIGGMVGGLAAWGANTLKYGQSVNQLGNDAAKAGESTKVAAIGSKLFGDALSIVPLGGFGLAAIAAAAAVGGILYFALKHTTDAAVQFNLQMQKLVGGSNVNNIGQNLTLAIAQTQKQMSLSLSSLTSAQTGYNKAVASTPTNVSSAQADSIKNILKQQEQLNAAQSQGQRSQEKANSTGAYAQYSAQLNTLINENDQYATRMGQLTKVFGSAGAAQQALNVIGVSAGTIATEGAAAYGNQYEKLMALAKGYGYMNQTAGAAGAQLSAINISTGSVTKNLQTLTSAESQWVAMGTSADSSFTQFEQGLGAIKSAMGGAANSAANIQVHFGQLSEKIPAYGATMNGLSASSLAVRSAFDQQLASGVTLFGNLQTLNVASGSTAASQKQLAIGGKAIIASMLPFAAGSKEATSELSRLAQLMGGPATDNFQVLAKWVGNTTGAAVKLNSAQANLVISSTNLTTAEKNLGNVIDTSITQAQSAALASTANLTGATTNLDKAFQSSHKTISGPVVAAAGEYMASLKNMNLSTGQAKQYLNAFLKQMGLTPGQIAEVDAQMGDSISQWNKYDSAVQHNTTAAKANATYTKLNAAAFASLEGTLPGSTSQLNNVWAALVKQDSAMVNSGKDTKNAKSEFVNFANQGLGISISKANDLWAAFSKQNLDELGNKAASTKGQFINMAMNGLHLTTEQAQTLWGEFAMQNLDEMVTKGDKMKDSFEKLAMGGLGLTTAQANTLWNTLKQQYLDTLAGKAGETRSAFEKTASQLGDTKAAADKLWASLHKLAAGSPYNTTTNDTISGSGGVVAKANIPGQPALSARLNFSAAAHGLASGGVVPGGVHGQDSVPAMLAPGELVVPSSHAPAFASMAKAAGIPGMAAGGFAGAAASQAGTINQVNPWTTTQSSQFATEATAAFASAVLKSAQNSLNVAGGAYSGPSKFGGGFESLAALVAYARYFMQNGLNAAAAAGMAATISGEQDSAGPESRGSGGWGLIGWTGNTVGLPPGYTGPTGNVAYDLSQQLKGVIGYMNARGGRGPLNAAGNPVAAGDVWSRYEAPASAGSDTRPALANEIYAALMGGSTQAGVKAAAAQAQVAGKLNQTKPHSSGGMVSEPVYGVGAYSGTPYSFAENGQPEYVGPISGGGGGGNSMMQPMTNVQGQTVNQQLAMLIKLWQQFPQAIGTAMQTSAGSGVRHGYYGAQG